MALDEVLLHEVASGNSQPILRFYRWQPATVSLGYAQSVLADINLEACRQANLDVVRRASGGRAVLHDHEVTYSVIAPFNAGYFLGSVLDIYRVISEILQKTLGEFGLNAGLVPGRSQCGRGNTTKAICFTAPSQYELVIDNRKIAGSAQKRYGNSFLQHGSIPLEMDLKLLGKVLKMDSHSENSEPLEKVGWLNLWSDCPLSVTDIEEKIAQVFFSTLQCPWKNSEPSCSEVRAAKQLCDEKYGNPEWNMMR